MQSEQECPILAASVAPESGAVFPCLLSDNAREVAGSGGSS